MVPPAAKPDSVAVTPVGALQQAAVSPKISVVVPVGPAETDLRPFLAYLQNCAAEAEWLFVFCPESQALRSQLVDWPDVSVLLSSAGRARQMNAGAAAAGGDFLWFVHLDSQLALLQWRALHNALMSADAYHTLYYFKLRFLADGSGPMQVNAWGANLRSRWLGVPFGDQGFCLSRRLFEQLGGYPEDAPYGEDHLLVWRARQQRVQVRCTGAYLPTSARKYAAYGWGRLTLRYQWLWIRQAVPQWCRLVAMRLGMR